MLDRQLTLHSPALGGDQKLFVRRIQGREALSELFAYDVTLYSKSDSVDFGKVLGQEMCIGLSNPRSLMSSAKGAAERYFHGYVSNFASIGAEGGYHLYRAELRPQLWRLSRSVNCRVFQNEAVPDIVAAVLKDHGITGMVTHYVREYRPWEYCVQYRESDLAFISRLLEREGIHYYFEHQKDKHILYLGDTNPREAIGGYEEVKLRGQNGPNQIDEDVIWSWCVSKSVLADRTTLSDYDFTKPGEPLLRTSGSEVKREHDDARDYEVYDFLETVVQQQGYSAELTEEYARIRSEELHTHYALVTAETNATGLAPGFCFKLKGDVPKPAKGVEYLLISMQLHAENDLRGSGTTTESAEVYRASFEAIEAKNPFRPARLTPKPRIPGPQSAIVVGPQGAKDHHTDQWGRVLVKFHWYRKLHESDKNMSCWVRVSQNSAGANWGSMFVPHIGQEVIVSFYEGDPDRPVVTGRVYNGSNKPPLELPANAYKSIIRDKFSNELIFDGTPGSEHVSLYSPSHRSALIVGKSTQEFTSSSKKSCSYDSESYTFGQKLSFTKGTSLSFDRGFFIGIKAGVGFSLTAGADVKASISNTLEFKGGMSATYLMSSSVTWGFGREFKKSKGSYTRMSDKDIVIDSSKTAYLTGGKNDNTLVKSDDSELVLSYDDSAADRSSMAAAVDSAAMANAATIAGLGALGSYIGASLAQFDVSRKGEQLNKETGVKSIQAELDQVSGLGWSDLPTAVGAFGSAFGAVRAVKHEDIPSPEHPAPSAKITLKKDYVQLFAGKDKDSELLLQKDGGMLLGAKRDVTVDSEKGAVNITAAKSITLKSSDSVVVDSVLKHRNMTVLK